MKWGDPLLYDLTLNTARVSIASCIEQVVALTRRPEFRETAGSRATLANLALEARVRAALHAMPETGHVDVTVVADGTRVTLRGMVEDDRGAQSRSRDRGKAQGRVRGRERTARDAPAAALTKAALSRRGASGARAFRA